MIASYQHGFVFVKTRKTAGTSIEIALSRFCGPRDVVTPISFSDEQIRGRDGVRPRNYTRSPAFERMHSLALRVGRPELARRTRRACRRRRVFWNHMGAREIRTVLGPAFWERAFKFSIDRHPYEKVVSQAWWRLRAGKAYAGREFDEVVDAIVEQGDYRNYDLYAIDGKLAVDHVMKYEELDQELRWLVEKLALPPLDLSRAKGGIRPRESSGFEVLSDAQKRRIQQVCAEEFELLGYMR